MLSKYVLPDGPPARRAATSWRVYRSGLVEYCGPPVGRQFMIPTNGRATAIRFAKTS